MAKTLTTYEMIPENPKRYLDTYDASQLTAFPKIVNYRPGTYSKTLLVYDADNRRYEMLLKHHISRGRTGYVISSGWDSFVRTHDLKAGDVVTFYRVLDESVSDDYYHVVRCLRKSDDVKGCVGTGKKTINDGQKDDGVKGYVGTGEKAINDGQKEPKRKYKVEARRKESGGLVIKLGRR